MGRGRAVIGERMKGSKEGNKLIALVDALLVVA